MNAIVDKQILRGHLPVLVLAILAERPRHGYAICKQLKARRSQALGLGEGTLYPLLYRLERQGHIRGEWQTGQRGKPRKVYRITASGRRQIRAHKADWQLLMQLFKEFMGREWVET